MRIPFLDSIFDEKSQALLGEESDHDYSSSTPLAFAICNYSSVLFFIFQFCYASYTLYILTCRNERSRSLIACTIMIMASSVCLSALFCIADDAFYGRDWTLKDKFFYVTCHDLPYLMVFMAHWIIFYQYLELAVKLPILIKIAEHA